MTTNWDRQVAHLVRPVKPTRLRSLQRQLTKAAVKARRGIPTRDHTEDSMACGTAARCDERVRADAHDRMLQRKRAQRHAARRHARPSVADTRINLWRRRREWLREAENLSLEPL